MTNRTYKIASIPGDGIGKEVLPAGQEIVQALQDRFGFKVEWTEFDWSCEKYLETGQMMPSDGIAQLKDFDSIYLGAVGWPTVPDHVSLWGLLLPIRRELHQYANVRRIRLLDGIQSPLAGRGPKDIDFVVVRENVEGEYSEIGGRLNRGTEDELAVQEAVFTRKGTDRIMRYAFELAKTRKRNKVTSATKSNGIMHSMPFWDERFAEMASRYPEAETDQFHIDILTAHFVLHPDWFEVVVASNLFGDILSDLGPAIAGSIGIAPSANINPEGEFPSMFEPVHGSAPDIAGKGVANPVAAIWTAAEMLDHLGESEAAQCIISAIEKSFRDDATKTRDLGGTGSTRDVTQAIKTFCADA
ncbi:tartrate dehydrogenase [Arenibacterium halophilum]|uniref:D-malate dehydrogenase [decarboxylating] n=1 Tax=Arenibacterium halophilum TaxID=2583821 RepID=A0ABY2X061_9RHOB|nr:tartrate dehydrogenase [Arenibacterium halophilum]TMV08309.1 tartrate dehydrogenase [Arenibacterium halophilum]